MSISISLLQREYWINLPKLRSELSNQQAIDAS